MLEIRKRAWTKVRPGWAMRGAVGGLVASGHRQTLTGSVPSSRARRRQSSIGRLGTDEGGHGFRGWLPGEGHERRDRLLFARIYTVTIRSIARLAIFALATMSLIACGSPPDGIVDDTNQVAIVPVTIAGDDLEHVAQVTSDQTTLVYQGWSLMQPLMTADLSHSKTFKGFHVVDAPYNQALLVPPEPLRSAGWFIVCGSSSYMEPHGACIIAGKVGASVVEFTAWTSDIERFSAIVDGLTDAVEKLRSVRVSSQT